MAGGSLGRGRLGAPAPGPERTANIHWERQTGFAEWEHLELTADGVINYQDDDRDLAEQWTYEQVLAGAIDDMVRNLFGGRVLAEIKEAARKRLSRSGGPVVVQ